MCPECEREYRAYELEDHLVEKHRWLQCPHCVHASPNKDEELLHLEEHKLGPCSECKLLQPYNAMKEHLLRSHSWILCSLCDEPFQRMVFPNHVEECHKQCSECSFNDGADTLRRHIRTEHSGVECNKCNEMLPGIGILTHMETHPGAECSICGWTGDLTDYPTHINDTHAENFISFINPEPNLEPDLEAATPQKRQLDLPNPQLIANQHI